MAGGPLIGPAPCPQYQVPVFNEDGSLNVAWYRFWAGLSGTVSGSSPVFPPVSFPGQNVSRETVDESIQSLLPSPAIPAPDQTGQIQQALPSPALPPVDQEARDLANAAFSRVPYPAAPPQIIVCTQATFPVLTGSSPTFVYVSDYCHMIFWDGSVAKFAGDQSGSLSLWENDPGTGYHIYDGSTVNQLNADGTITSVTLSDLTSSGALAAFLEAGGTNSGPTAAVAGTVAASGANSMTGANSMSGPNSMSGSGSISGDTGNDSGSGTIVASGAGATVASHTHTHDGSSLSSVVSVSGSVSVSGTISVSGTVTVAGTSTGAEPRKLVRRPYFRQ